MRWSETLRKCSLMLGLALMTSVAIAAGPGTPDTTFTANTGSGFDNQTLAVAIDTNNKILVGGLFTSINGTPSNRIARLNANGTPDTSFTTQIGTGFDDVVHSLAIQADGKIVVGGQFTSINSTPSNYIARLNADGTTDTTFSRDIGTGFSGSVRIVRAIAIQADGKIVVGGNFTSINGTPSNHIARLNADGTPDSSFNSQFVTGFNHGVYAVAIQTDGKIVVGGQFTSINSTPSNHIARLNADGSPDTTFITQIGTGFNASVWSLAIQTDGKIVVGGSFASINRTPSNHIARLNADGTPDTSFSTQIGTGFDYSVYGLAIQTDGKIVVGGQFISINSTPSIHIARLNPDGTPDTDYSSNTGSGLDSWVSLSALALQSTGEAVVGGAFTQVNRVTSNHIARFLNTGLSPSTQTVNGTAGTAITPTSSLTPSRFAGSVTYSVSPSLPANLSLDSSTGVISGIPAAAQSSTIYTITGSDGSSSATATVDITVVAPPYSISPSSQSVSGVVGTAISSSTAFTPSGFGGTVSYTVSPSLPANLSLDSSTGIISGTPSATQSSTNYTVTATGSTSGSATATVSITVAQGSQTVSFGTATTPTYSPLGTFSVSATATSTLPVTFSSLTTGVCTVSGSTVTMVTAGTCSIAGDQSGNSNWTAAPQQTQNITIAQANQATFTASATPATINVGGVSAISVTGGSGTGTVTYALVSGSPCTLLGTTLTALGQGICSVTATKPADTNYFLATSNAIVNVNLAPQTALTVVPSSSNINVNGTSTLSTTGGNGTGPVTYAVTSGPCSVSGSTLTGTGAGTCSVTATKAADSTYASATSSPVTVTVSGPPPVINLVATPGPGLIRLDFTSNSQTPAAATARFQTMTGVIYTGNCVSTNGGVTASATGNSSPLTVTQVTAGKNYTCAVTGTDGSGSSTSAPSNAVIPQPAPQPPKPIPTLSEWAQILMMLMMVITAGWYGRRQLR